MNNYYEHPRLDIVQFIQENKLKLQAVLDVGCGTGSLGKVLKKIYKLERLDGIELNKDAGNKAKKIYDKVFIGEVNQFLNNYADDTKYDVIIFADVLEHLVNPWLTLKNIQKLLNPEGIIVASIPNLSFHGALRKIILDKWIYTDSGILDKTHLRFFTKSTILNMFKDAGYKISHIKEETYPGYKKRIFNYLTMNKLKHLTVGKYLVMAQKL